MSVRKELPVSEIFTSPQGEGVFAGTMMTFIRLAGCTVGKPFPKERYEPVVRKTRTVGISTTTSDMINTLLLPIYTEKCTLYDGREFPCDTDYRVTRRMIVEEIVEEVPDNIQHVCITGGEPLMHPLFAHLHRELHISGHEVHLETSGTIPFSRAYKLWITVSPKHDCKADMIERADEIKLLVDSKVDLNKPYLGIDWRALAQKKPIYLQPVNFEHEVNPENVIRCLAWQKIYPQFRVCLQLHKVLSHYTEELVR